ncbi:MAG: hypothetical protein EOO61_17235 [Hymenobacter sp.]|nr:MAG: hypothetical protein EOO61_17235 [Hymenobacter sp.]
MGLFKGYFDDFTTFRQICFFLAVITLLLLTFVWPALINSFGTNAPAVWGTVGAMSAVILIGFAGATIPFLTARRKDGYRSL